MNRIERFIIQNRPLLDSEEVSDSVWNKIKLPETGKKGKRKAVIRSLYKWSIAAVSTGIILIGIFFFIQKPDHKNTIHAGNYMKADSSNDVVANNSENKSDSESATALGNDETAAGIALSNHHASETDDIYKTIVARQDELKTIAGTYPELYRRFAKDLATLDSSYRLLKSQANSSVNRDVIIKAMIENLQLQAELLNRQLTIIQQFKNLKNENDETKNNQRNI